MSSRSSWLAGNVRKSEGMETVLMRTGDIPPGPGTYSDPRSSFATFSHNTKVMVRMIDYASCSAMLSGFLLS